MDDDVRTNKNETITKEIYNLLIECEYKDWKKIFQTIELLYKINKYKKFTNKTNENYIPYKIIQSEFWLPK